MVGSGGRVPVVTTGFWGGRGGSATFVDEIRLHPGRIGISPVGHEGMP